MKEIVVATRNRKKLIELIRLLKGIDIKVQTLNDFHGLPNIKEDGLTFAANAKKKATGISNRIDKLVIADDSGLEVSALRNAPGVKSARYAGPGQEDQKNINLLLKRMKGIPAPKRKARFICVICLSKGKKVIKIVEGRVEGKIATEQEGRRGFGYDPVFIPNGYDKTFAQLGSRVKDSISHRAVALKKAKAAIERYFQKHP